MGARENKLQKLPIKQNEILHMTILPVSIPVEYEINFPGSHKKLSLVLLQIPH